MNVESIIEDLIILNRPVGLPPRRSLSEGKKKVAEKLGVSIRTVERYVTAGEERSNIKGALLEKAIKIYKKQFRLNTYKKKAFNEDEYKEILEKAKKSKQYKTMLKIAKNNFVNKDLIHVIRLPYLNERQFLYYMKRYYFNTKMQALRFFKSYIDGLGKMEYVSKSFNFTDIIKVKKENVDTINNFMEYADKDMKDSFFELQEMEMF